MESMNVENYVSEAVRGAGVGFARIRRITGYLVGELDRFNSAKLAEVNDRVSHATVSVPDSMVA